MKIVKIILRYLVYGLVLFVMSGIMFSMIKNSDNATSSKKIFDDTRNFAKTPATKVSNQKETQYVPKTKPYKKNQSDCLRIKDRADLYSNEANTFDLNTASSACKMAKNLDQVLSFMQTLEKKSCSEFDNTTYNTYVNLHKMAILKCRQ